MPEPEITEEQASEALHQLLPTGEETEASPPAAVEAEPSTGEAQPAEPAVEAAPAEEPAAAEDDLESLKQRNEQLQADVKTSEERFDAKLQALQQRNVASEQILRDRYLRKSTTLDRVGKVLRATRTEAGVSEADVDNTLREIDGGVNPQSASYVAPIQQQAPAGNEDQELTLNSFLNEKQMTSGEADEFGKWIRSEATTVMSEREQAVAGSSLDGFLRLAHGHWQSGIREKEKETKQSDAVGAVRSVQRTQREAAKAASAATTAPKKQPAGSAEEVDVSKLTNEEVSSLLRQSVEQYQ